MHIDELLLQLKSDTLTSIPRNWTQGRTVHGGLNAALLYQSMRNRIEPGRVLRSLNTQFIGPLAADEPFEIRVEILREGKNVTVAEARAYQYDRCCTAVTACFGLERASKISIAGNSSHSLRPAKKRKIPYFIPKVSPKFLRHVDIDPVEGGLPFTGRKESSYAGWMRFKKPPQAILDAHIITLIDAWPPTVLQMVRGPKPVSTLSWNLEFLHPHRSIGPEDWFAYRASTIQAGDGYAHTEAEIWDQHGEKIALSRQVVTIFD